jgi:hypothetical protein
MADVSDLLHQVRPGQMTPEEGLAKLDELWGVPVPSAEQSRADAWARRATGQPKQAGDDRLLSEVDAQIAAKYGRSVHRAS